ncbi:ATPase, T2SS/T4P/T4SS family [Marasmitruncus massiliensis]|uniref:ATPase, T2SS/T4P/T4SS family n=1 Tax=Marasmitruncus massiliensis TaxID=1944642 RepID=UPI000C79F58B|nr:ATPase, T2SS/T4P/T4SS family [Marasmitruncus massiliensis]
MTEAPSLNDYLFSVQGHTPYRDVLQKVQQYMSKEYADLFSKQELTKEDTFLIKKNIENYLIEASINCNESKNLTELTDRLYKDMVLYSFLTDYLSPEKVEELGLEEINVNSWECIFLQTSKKGKIRLEEQFLSPQHAIDVITRMLRHSGMVIDDAKPLALGHIAKNVRIAVFKTPVLDEEIGVSCSIRIVSFSKLTRRNLVKEYETIPGKALDFLESCMRYGVSICLAGETGSGKTGTVGYVLSSISANADKRVITVEEGSREFDLIRRDENGRVKNDVVHLLTRPSENEKQNISQDYLLENILRYDPDIIGVGEMRSHEAITAAEASRTGHTVATTTHSYSAPDTYERLVELAQKVSRASEDALYRKMIGAFPIIVYQEKLTDGSRKVTEIIEGETYKNGELQYRTLWNYKITDNYIDENNQPKVVGSFIEGEKISDRLRSRLIKKGMAKSVADQY